jgi:hypothetical protein
MVCDVMDCEYGFELLSDCDVKNCYWVCDNMWGNEEPEPSQYCSVDFTYNGTDYWGVECMNFTWWLDNTTQYVEDNNCEIECW